MQTIGERLRQRRKELKKTQLQLGNAIGVSGVTVSQWENDPDSPPSRYEHIIVLCKILKCSPEWLLEGKTQTPTPALKKCPEVMGKIPLINYEQASQWRQILNTFELGDAEEWRTCTSNVSPIAFAVRAIGDFMESPKGGPRTIPENSIVIIDPDISAESGHIVFAVLKSGQATIKQLIIDGPNNYLMPLNPRYKDIPLDEMQEIIGVVVRVEIEFISQDD